MATASICVVMAGAKTLMTRSTSAIIISKTLSPKHKPATPFPSSSSTKSGPRTASRLVSALGAAESMMPLHSVIAKACLNSNIAVDSSYWSWLSQDSDVPR